MPMLVTQFYFFIMYLFVVSMILFPIVLAEFLIAFTEWIDKVKKEKRMDYNLMCYGTYNSKNLRCLSCPDSSKCENEMVLKMSYEDRQEYLKEKEAYDE